MGHAVFIDLVGDECVVHIGQGQDAGGCRNLRARQALGVATAIPLFLVREDEFLGEVEQRRGAAHGFLGPHQGLVTCGGVGAHDVDLVCRQSPGLEQNAVGYAYRAHVVQGHAVAQGVDGGGGEHGRKSGVGAELFGQHTHIALHAQDVALGVRLALFGQGGHGKHHHAQGVLDFIGRRGAGGCGRRTGRHGYSPGGAVKGARYNHTILPPTSRYWELACRVVA
jgi:hypothetical protein